MANIRYKDGTLSTSTELYRLIEAGEVKKAEAHNKQLDQQFKKEFPPELWEKIKNEIRNQRTSG